MDEFPRGFVLHRGAEGRAGREVLKVAPNLAVEVTGLAVRKADLVK